MTDASWLLAEVTTELAEPERTCGLLLAGPRAFLVGFSPGNKSRTPGGWHFQDSGWTGGWSSVKRKPQAWPAWPAQGLPASRLARQPFRLVLRCPPFCPGLSPKHGALDKTPGLNNPLPPPTHTLPQLETRSVPSSPPV